MQPNSPSSRTGHVSRTPLKFRRPAGRHPRHRAQHSQEGPVARAAERRPLRVSHREPGSERVAERHPRGPPIVVAMLTRYDWCAPTGHCYGTAGNVSRDTPVEALLGLALSPGRLEGGRTGISAALAAAYENHRPGRAREGSYFTRPSLAACSMRAAARPVRRN